MSEIRNPVADAQVTRLIAKHYFDDIQRAVESDVIIVGAGPAGLSCAWTLGDDGYMVTMFDKKLAPGLPRIEGDSRQIEQVFIHLLTNAFQALEGEDKRVSITTSYSEHSRVVVIDISDEGIGIDLGDIPRVFDPFFTTRKDKGGTGLGLSIANAIVTRHGGSIEFKSWKKHGTTARVKLPVRTKEA